MALTERSHELLLPKQAKYQILRVSSHGRSTMTSSVAGAVRGGCLAIQILSWLDTGARATGEAEPLGCCSVLPTGTAEQYPPLHGGCFDIGRVHSHSLAELGHLGCAERCKRPEL